jgi:hypothetical protein
MGRMRNLLIPGVDKTLLVRDAVKTMPDLTRRRFISGGASLGALTLLTGCDVTDSFSAEEMLKQVSKFNDGVQALIFNPNAMAPTFPESAITNRSRSMPITTSMTRHRRRQELEAGSARPGREQEILDAGRALSIAAGQADHAPHLRRRLERDRKLDRDAAARFPESDRRGYAREICLFQCADKDGYNSPLDMATALHAQTQMTFKFGDEILPRAYGFPMKIRVPTKLGFKNPKYVMSMEVTNDYKGGFWEDQGYNSFSGS